MCFCVSLDHYGFVFVLLALVFHYRAKGRTCPKWPILCRVGRKTLLCPSGWAMYTVSVTFECPRLTRFFHKMNMFAMSLNSCTEVIQSISGCVSIYFDIVNCMYTLSLKVHHPLIPRHQETVFALSSLVQYTAVCSINVWTFFYLYFVYLYIQGLTFFVLLILYEPTPVFSRCTRHGRNHWYQNHLWVQTLPC